MGVIVKSRSKSLKDTEVVLTGENKNLESILLQLSNNNKGISKYRLRLTYLKENKQIPIIEDSFFENFNADGMELFVKDLGPQISWRLVFCAEYFGPILIHSLAYWLSKQPSVASKLQSSSNPPNPALNKIAYYLVIAHYLKREFETIFVHQFSLATMPLFNLFKNSFHYWVLNGAIAIGYFGYGFLFNDERLFEIYQFLGFDNLGLLIGLFTISELWNFYIHIRLRLWGDKQKKLGNTKKRVPINGGIFKVLIAPNYSFEVWSWIWFALIFKLNVFSLIFLAVSTVQMYLWAQKKNRKYRTRRAFLIPYIF